MKSYNNIGIDNILDWKRIRKLFIIVLLGGLLLTMRLAQREKR